MNGGEAVETSEGTDGDPSESVVAEIQENDLVIVGKTAVVNGDDPVVGEPEVIEEGVGGEAGDVTDVVVAEIEDLQTWVEVVGNVVKIEANTSRLMTRKYLI